MPWPHVLDWQAPVASSSLQGVVHLQYTRIDGTCHLAGRTIWNRHQRQLERPPGPVLRIVRGPDIFQELRAARLTKNDTGSGSMRRSCYWKGGGSERESGRVRRRISPIERALSAVLVASKDVHCIMLELSPAHATAEDMSSMSASGHRGRMAKNRSSCG